MYVYYTMYTVFLYMYTRYTIYYMYVYCKIKNTVLKNICINLLFRQHNTYDIQMKIQEARLFSDDSKNYLTSD